MTTLQVFIDDADSPPDIWAHHTTMEQFERFSKAGGAGYLRAMRQFGPFLPDKEQINAGIGPRLRFKDTEDSESTSALVFPNRFLVKDEEEHVVAGMKTTLFVTTSWNFKYKMVKQFV